MPSALKVLDTALKVLLESGLIPILEQNTIGVFEISTMVQTGSVEVIS